MLGSEAALRSTLAVKATAAMHSELWNDMSRHHYLDPSGRCHGGMVGVNRCVGVGL
jgi:hypothetical protein